MDPAIHPNLHLVDFNNLGSHCTDFNALLGSHNNLTDSSNFNSENIQAQRASASLATNENTCILTADQSNSAPTGSHNLTNQLGKRAPVTKRAKRGPYKKQKFKELAELPQPTSTTVPGISHLATPSVPGNSNSTTTPLVPAIANSTSPREENGPQLVQSVLDADAHIIRNIQASTCKAKRITNHIKDELQKIMLEYQKQVQLLAI
ncbi:hypothetical protein PCANC_26372 [Puccinia coronata f. sp. avenae]|uniref:Uncharacterized protein n=1 Tax=Puccinia coronata f. sp. avenae TaxID=200324 RepID=A0A2N5S4V2_9BASI|nr:hypothetical protein PCANC_26372 [Puccinia coronata f. sp. avenae]